jgi:hypothetical protein
VAGDAVKGLFMDHNKKRKISKKVALAFNSHPAPKLTQVKDKVDFNVRTYHAAGEPILPSAMLISLTEDLSSLHDAVLKKDKHMLKSKDNPHYPFF